MLLAFTNADASILHDAESLLTLIKIVVSLGVATAVTTAWRHYRHRLRWRTYKQLVDQWFSTARVGFAEAMTDEEWNTLSETLLADANFNPFEAQQLLPLAVTVAKGMMAAGLWEL